MLGNLNFQALARLCILTRDRRKRADGSAIEYFDEACCALLHRILDLSGALSIKVTDKDRPSSNGSLAIIDLGFGCGDQTWELARLAQSNGRRTFRYVGLTLNEAQMQTASRRIQRELATMPDNVSGLELDSFKLFCANAAKPDSWSPTIRSAVDAVAEEKFTDRWVLALDCLYHFSPSRKPIFTYAAQKLDAQFMAFDLILNDNATTWDKILARAGCFMMGCPLFTFLTEKQYKDQLVASGYDRSLITIQDISDDVFQGVTRYLERQERGLAQYGVSMGGFKLAGRIFGWYDKSRVVKASIVVARIKPKVS